MLVQVVAIPTTIHDSKQETSKQEVQFQYGRSLFLETGSSTRNNSSAD